MTPREKLLGSHMVLGRAPGLCSQDKQRQMTYGSRRDKVSLHKDSVRIQNSHVLLPATTQTWCFHKLKQKQQTKQARNGNKTNYWVVVVRAVLTCEPEDSKLKVSLSYRVKPCFQKKKNVKTKERL